MSSIEQKIREVLLHEICVDDSEEERLVMNRLTQSILQIIEDDVIGEDENPEGEPPYATISGYRADIEIVVAQSQNALRAEQRANLREDK